MAVQFRLNNSDTGPRVGGATSIIEVSNLPIERIGRDDLVGITVYDAPELTRTVRVGSDGDMRLPMLKQPIHAPGLAFLPSSRRQKTIAAALIDERCSIVTVSVVEQIDSAAQRTAPIILRSIIPPYRWTEHQVLL